jgi:aldehyde dehydrogenase (NAD+)
VTITAPHPGLPSGALLIGDERLDEASGGWYDHVNPTTGLVQKRIPIAGTSEVDLAVGVARRAFPAWRAMEPNVRRNLLLDLADMSLAKGADLAPIAALENGMNAVTAGWLCAYQPYEYFRYYGGYVDKLEGAVVPSYPGPSFNYTVPEPLGVIGIIIPWNGPIGSFAMTVVPALAAGNCVVLKPAENAAFTCLEFSQWCLDAGLPPGVLNVIPGTGEAGDALVRHPGIDKISFTGGLETARKVGSAAGQTIKPVVLELGGKSANIVFADADTDAASTLAVDWGLMTLNGQGCALPTRLIVHDSIYDEVVEKVLARLAATQVIGDPLDPTTNFGPMATKVHYERVLHSIEQATANQDGELLTGGGAADREGFFVQPTVFGDVSNSSELARTEVFGPVMAAMRFSDEEEAVKLANDSPYGLAAYLFTQNLSRAHRMASALDAGAIGVNGSFSVAPNVPYGGVKSSGFGREGGRAGIEEFIRWKNVNVTI